jgi:hypothetical protein
MQRPLVKGKVRTNRAPEVGIEVGNVKLVARGTDDRFVGACRPIDEGHLPALGCCDAWTTHDGALIDLREVILAERQPGNAHVNIGLGSAEVSGIAGDPQYSFTLTPAPFV